MKKLIYAQDAFEAKYKMLINRRKNTGLNQLNDFKAFIDKNVEEYKPNNKRKILIVFDKMIPNMLSNKKLNPLGTELFIRGRKLNILNISLLFYTTWFLPQQKILD